MRANKTLYRNSENARIAGVCSGIADYFGIEVWLVRIITLSSFFLLAPPFIFFGYIACWFILDKKPKGVKVDMSSTVPLHGRRESGNSKHEVRTDTTMEVKTKVWQAGEPPRQFFHDICERFSSAEQRLQKMETFVTSKAYQLKREINRL